MGLLQLNDRRPGVFSPQLISLWERLAGYLAVAVTKYRADEALGASEAKYRDLFENMTEEVHLWELVRDAQGEIRTWRLVDANPRTLKTWDRPSLAEIKGKTIEEIFGPGLKEHYLPSVRKTMAEGIPYSFEEYVPYLGRYFQFNSIPLGNFFITTGTDITAIKQAEVGLR